MHTGCGHGGTEATGAVAVCAPANVALVAALLRRGAIEALEAEHLSYQPVGNLIVRRRAHRMHRVAHLEREGAQRSWQRAFGGRQGGRLAHALLGFCLGPGGVGGLRCCGRAWQRHMNDVLSRVLHVASRTSPTVAEKAGYLPKPARSLRTSFPFLEVFESD